MRHRAPRSFLARIPLPDPARRRVLAGAALAVTAALTGVGVAVQHDDPAPSAARTPVTAQLGTPSSGTPSTLTNAPSKAVSRGGDRTPRPSATPLPSPTSTSPAAEETTSALPLVTRTPKVGVPTVSKKPTPSAPKPSASPSAPSPADQSAPDTAASTSAVGGGSWTVAVSADEPASYECSLDGGSYQSCGGSTTFSDLENGWHSLTARATDQAGNTDPSPAELSAKVTGSH